jgi:hypothetical protein
MSELDAFLTTGTQPPDPGAPAPAAPATEPAGGGPSGKEAPPATTKTAEPAPEAAKQQPEPQPDPEDEVGHDGGMIPASTFHKARTDWKGKVVAAETEARLLREQLEAAKKPTSPAAPQAPLPAAVPLDPVRDPVGYHNRLQSVLLNDRLNISEMLERDKHTPEAFESAVTEFQEAAKQQPDLYAKLHAQRHPYGWLMKEVEKLRVQRDMGDDPAAFRARIAAEERAKVEAEMRNGGAPPVSPAAGLPPSLANTRSAAPRSTNGFSGPPSLEDLLRREPRRR